MKRTLLFLIERSQARHVRLKNPTRLVKEMTLSEGEYLSSLKCISEATLACLLKENVEKLTCASIAKKAQYLNSLNGTLTRN